MKAFDLCRRLSPSSISGTAMVGVKSPLHSLTPECPLTCPLAARNRSGGGAWRIALSHSVSLAPRISRSIMLYPCSEAFRHAIKRYEQSVCSRHVGAFSDDSSCVLLRDDRLAVSSLRRMESETSPRQHLESALLQSQMQSHDDVRGHPARCSAGREFARSSALLTPESIVCSRLRRREAVSSRRPPSS